MRDQPIVVLHGWGLNSNSYSNLKDNLTRHFRKVLIPDLPGFGKTPAPDRPFGSVDYAKYLSDFLEKENITKCILVGHSFGGRIALKFAHIYPQKVIKLVLTGTPVIRDSNFKRSAFYYLAKSGKVLFKIPYLNKL